MISYLTCSNKPCGSEKKAVGDLKSVERASSVACLIALLLKINTDRTAKICLNNHVSIALIQKESKGIRINTFSGIHFMCFF